MNDPATVTVTLPRMTTTMKRVSLAVVGVWLVQLMLTGFARFAADDPLGPFGALALMPARVLRGEVWRALTYVLVQPPDSTSSVAGLVLTLWLLGTTLERRWGAGRVLAMMAAATVAGAVLVTAAGALYLPMWVQRTVGPSPVDAAVAFAWARVNWRVRGSFFGLVDLEGRHFALVMVVLSLGSLVFGRHGGAVATLAGMLVGAVFAASRGVATPVTRARAVSLRMIRGGAERDDDIDPHDVN